MRLSRTERFLRVFTDVRPGEGSTALLMFANVFLILCAYYLVKPLREGWIAISGIPSLSKMEVKAYSSLVQSLLLIVVIGRYALLVDRFPRVTVITRVTLFCISNLVVFWFLQPEFFLQNLPHSLADLSKLKLIKTFRHSMLKSWLVSKRLKNYLYTHLQPGERAFQS